VRSARERPGWLSAPEAEAELAGDWNPGSGWNRTGIGGARAPAQLVVTVWSAVCYGGPTFQGLLPLLFRAGGGSGGRRGVALDSRRYDNMAVPGSPDAAAAASDVTTFHFTACQKPWRCVTGSSPLCAAMHAEWWRVWRSAVPPGTAPPCRPAAA
jgi:hypothetical protein